ncbi:acetate/propionate family kinase, partial [Butyricimonas sp.]
MNVLVLNCGSSSIKYQLLDMAGEPTLLAKGLVEKIGLPVGSFTHKPEGKDKYVVEEPIADHTAGIDLILKALVDPKHGVITALTDINAVGHRVAHGGEFFAKSARVDEDAKKKIAACCELAPLHNPANLKGIETMEKLLPGIPQVAVFDTSFHQTLPKEAYIYGLPYKYYEDYRIRRYGFHGTSHKFVAEKACKILGWNIEEKKIITCHLGNGSSITAINKGKSVDTSMGFTPNAGVI